jgi:hypothetical protein
MTILTGKLKSLFAKPKPRFFVKAIGYLHDEHSKISLAPLLRHIYHQIKSHLNYSSELDDTIRQLAEHPDIIQLSNQI